MEGCAVCCEHGLASGWIDGRTDSALLVPTQSTKLALEERVRHAIAACNAYTSDRAQSVIEAGLGTYV